MPDTQISLLPSTTATASLLAPVENSAGTLTSKVTLGAIAALGGGPPASHAASHATAGPDPITPASIGAVATSDSRLTDSRTPLSHAASHATNGTDPISPAAIGAAASNHNHDITTLTNAGTAAARNVPVAGNAGSAEVVLGSDTRLANSRIPTSHSSSHQIGGADYVPPLCVTPAALSASQNDYAPGAADILYLTSSANVSITGLSATGIPDGHTVLLMNVNASGGSQITLAHESASSSAANRLRSSFGSNAVLFPDGGSVLAIYHAALSRWRLL